MAEVVATSPLVAPRPVRRWRADDFIKAFFGSNALIAIVVLALITIFLFREGFGFFGQNLRNIRLYRRAGLEYVDIMRDAANAHAALSRGLNLTRKSAQATESAETLARFDQFSAAFSDSADDLNGLVSDAGEKAVALRDALALQAGDVDRGGEKEEHASAAPVDEAATISALRANTATFAAISSTMAEKVRGLLQAPPAFENAKTKRVFDSRSKRVENYLAILPGTTKKLATWDTNAPVPAYRAVTGFLFGREWTTASFWQDWYGIIPLLVGSIMVSIVGLAIAVAFGWAWAIYVIRISFRAEELLIQ